MHTDAGSNGEPLLPGASTEEPSMPCGLRQLVALWHSIGPELQEAVTAFPELPDPEPSGLTEAWLGLADMVHARILGVVAGADMVPAEGNTSSGP